MACLAAAPAAVALFPAWLRAQAGGGEHSALVLELPSSARAAALGGAFAAVGEDDAALFHNPAQLATVRGRAATLSAQRHVASSTLGALSAAARLGAGTLALGIRTLGYGSAPEVVPDPGGGGRGVETGARVSAGELAVTGGYALPVRARLRLGVAGTLVHQRVAGAGGGSGALDVGAAWAAHRRLTVGAAAQHLGPGITLAGVRAPLPRTLRLGAAAQAARRGALALLATAEIQQVAGGRARWAGGAEGTWAPPGRVQLVARVGVVTRDIDGVAEPLSFGGSLLARPLAVDYAYRGFGALGGTHRVAIRWAR